MEKYTKQELLQYVGDLSQVFGIQEYTLRGGRSQGVNAVNVRNASGLEFTVIPDRCLDIAGLTVRGVNLSYIGKPGIVAPQYYNESGFGFFRSFSAGFLTTCGLRNVGTPCLVQGEAFGMHGRISNTPAEHVHTGTEWNNGEPILKISGSMREACVFGENLFLHREILCKAYENTIVIKDTVENLGFRPEAVMLLYHFNFGFPLLNEHAELLHATPKYEDNRHVGSNTFQKPTPGFQEQIYAHSLIADTNGNTCVALINEKLAIGAVIRYNVAKLPTMAQWKMLEQGEYVLGIEPCNFRGNNRAKACESGSTVILEPGGTETYTIEINILDHYEQIISLKHEISELKKQFEC